MSREQVAWRDDGVVIHLVLHGARETFEPRHPQHGTLGGAAGAPFYSLDAAMQAVDMAWDVRSARRR